MKPILILFITFGLLSCKNKTSQKQDKIYGKALKLNHAQGFSVEDFGTYKILEIKDPWPKSEKTYRYALLQNNAKNDFPKTTAESFDGILNIPINRIVVTSTTHVANLDLLNQTQTLVGFPQTDFISSKKARTLIENGNVRELGKNESINTEVILELKPDVVIGFGIDGNTKVFETIKKSGIPVIFNGDWVEHSPLAKAEWIKFFGVLFNKETQSDSIFDIIEKNYSEAKILAKQATERPTVLSGAMHGDIWFLPNGKSTEAQLLHDANTRYLWQDTKGSGSLSLSFETVYTKAKNADIWLNPSIYNSMESLKAGNLQHAAFNAFKTNRIYTFTNTTGTTGGVTYFEEGFSRPDLALKDLIKICHPQLLPNYNLYFYKHLN
ncbi:MAG: ABC transporter substrate-binding protein [Aestuariibaculum sp.]